jgi:two-component system, OmpR family, alkaline phosphatase synthesis response regulator PhoP
MSFRSALLVEDEPMLAETLKISLRKLGIRTQHATTLSQARALLIEGDEMPDLVVLDRGLPDGDGLEVCTELRESKYEGAILILTAAGTITDRVSGLNAGADDYLPKPFSWEELAARIHALSRRFPQKAGTAAQEVEKAWNLDEANLRIRGVSLTPLEFKLASHLILANGAIVSREELLKEVWGFRFLPKTRTVDHFLGRLRKHFERNIEDPRHFLTVRGAGYRFKS